MYQSPAWQELAARKSPVHNSGDVPGTMLAFLTIWVVAMQELSTALRFDLNPIIFLLNNKGYVGFQISMPAEFSMLVALKQLM